MCMHVRPRQATPLSSLFRRFIVKIVKTFFGTIFRSEPVLSIIKTS